MSKLAGVSVRVGNQLIRGLRPPKDVEEPEPPSNARFPGDPRTLQTGKLYYGQSQDEGKDITQFEAAAGKNAGVRRTFYSTPQGQTAPKTAAWTPPGGAMFDTIAYDHGKGRLPIVSQAYRAGEWPAIADGSMDDLWDDQIAYIETAYQHPVWMAHAHEPENNGGSESAYRAMHARFRQRMTAYENNHGPLKNLAYGLILTAYGYKSITKWYGGDGVYDWLGADIYAWTTSTQLENANWLSFYNFTKTKKLPGVVAEWGVQRRDPIGATKMRNFYKSMLDGTHDVIAMAYFNSAAAERNFQWMLDNVDNGGMLNAHHDLMGRDTSCTMAEMGF